VSYFRVFGTGWAGINPPGLDRRFGTRFGQVGPSARKRTVAVCTQCHGPGIGGHEPLIRSGIEGPPVPTRCPISNPVCSESETRDNSPSRVSLFAASDRHRNPICPDERHQSRGDGRTSQEKRFAGPKRQSSLHIAQEMAVIWMWPPVYAGPSANFFEAEVREGRTPNLYAVRQQFT